MRRSNLFLLILLSGLIGLSLILLHSSLTIKERQREISLKAEMVRILDLTDLCLFTEARYTRNPSVADISTPFQDYPFCLEHFPSGSLIIPPGHIKR